MEKFARSWYEEQNNLWVNEVGLCVCDNKNYGASPDGLINEDGGLEIKCPSLAVHVGYLLEAKIPTEYFQQVQGNLLVTSRKWWDFLSYYPGIKPCVVRAYPDDKFLSALKTELDKFCAELDEIVEKITNFGEKCYGAFLSFSQFLIVSLVLAFWGLL